MIYNGLENGNIIERNKLRINLIKNNDFKKVSVLFKKVQYCIENKFLFELKIILQDELYFEIIPNKFLDNLVNTYNKIDKSIQNQYINELKQSYMIRGTKGIRFSLGGIINKFANANQTNS